jgi:hypothetical protein
VVPCKNYADRRVTSTELHRFGGPFQAVHDGDAGLIVTTTDVTRAAVGDARQVGRTPSSHSTGRSTQPYREAKSRWAQCAASAAPFPAQCFQELADSAKVRTLREIQEGLFLLAGQGVQQQADCPLLAFRQLASAPIAQARCPRGGAKLTRLLLEDLLSGHGMGGPAP